MKPKALLSLLALMLMGSTGAVKAQSVKAKLGSDATTHNDQFFTGKTVTIDLATVGSVKITATEGYGGTKSYTLTNENLEFDLSSDEVEPVQVIHPEGADPAYNVGTHVASKRLDFSNPEQDMTAYVATKVDADKGTVTLKQETVIENGSAFVVRADEPGWYCVPFGGSQASYTNLFKGSATQASPLESGKTYYTLHKSGVFAKINTESVHSVPAGEAYLEVTGNGTESLAFVFDGDNDNATAIDAFNADDNDNANAKVIKGGKLIIIKNGKEYNAAGAAVE